MGDRTLVWLGPAALLLALGSWSACTGSEIIQGCGEIALGGCPTEHGGTCDDSECDALYSCQGGVWQLVEECPVGTGGSGAGGAAGGQGGTGDGGEGGCESLPIDDPYGLTCPMPLQLPECEVVVTEVCHPCVTGCQDFFLCVPDGSGDVYWELVAFCNEDDQVELSR
ncbi:MAG: hypothetical protein JRI68_23905 [Deltaproteobacteria bacterium]|nr:hypothetical protein [Deltaproteobacteria bacterium]